MRLVALIVERATIVRILSHLGEATELSGEGGTREAAYQFGLSEDSHLANGRARRRCD